MTTMKDVEVLAMKCVILMFEVFKKHWSQVFFGAVGILFLFASIYQLWKGEIASTSATFVMAFFSFFYANISRFKHFEGLGFKAELWDDKQKEATILIEKLRDVVTIYTRQIIIGQVMQGRRGKEPRWKDHWKLYDDLVAEHGKLGQKIDFSEIKKALDVEFLADITTVASTKLASELLQKLENLRQNLTIKHGSREIDEISYKESISKINSMLADGLRHFSESVEGNVAMARIQKANELCMLVKSGVGYEMHFDAEVLKILSDASQLYESGDIKVTERLIALAEYS